MHPATKFYTLVASGTVAVMLALLTWLLPLLQSIALWPSIGSWVAGILTSVGIYRLIGKGAECLIQHCTRVRRWIFGGTYLHGTWVGYFIGRAGDKRYIFEHIDQDLDGVVINGQSYTVDLVPHADWTSVSVSIEARTGRLIFSYTLTLHSRQGTIVGINSSQLERKSHRHAATMIAGHSQDLGDQVRVQVREVKVSDELLPWDEALKLAQQKFGEMPEKKA